MKTPFISLFVALLSCTCFGAVPPAQFSGPITNVIPFTPHFESFMAWSSAAADFNLDGKMDLVVGYYNYDGLVQVLLGRGDGTFSVSTNLTAGSLPAAVAVGDFNGDGKPDIAALGSSDVTIFLGMGDGNFATQTNLNGGANLNDGGMSIVAGDFNGDGADDLVIAGGLKSVTVFLGHRDGSFSPPASYPVGGHSHGVAVGDVNNDGILDLVTANNDEAGSVSVLLGKGDGTFLSASNYPAGAYTYNVAIGDFDNDSWPDLIAANWDLPSTVSLFRGLGGGAFAPATNLDAIYDYPGTVTTGDFNGDGNLDFAITWDQDFRVNVRFGDGHGGFANWADLTAAWTATHVLTADLNGDGRPDVVATTSDAVVTFLNQTSPTLQILPSANQVELVLPRWGGFLLETASTFPCTNGWTAQPTNGFSAKGSQNISTNSLSGTNQFYRLRRP